jgi:sodium/potassium-transporting ATPase subunit alpha
MFVSRFSSNLECYTDPNKTEAEKIEAKSFKQLNCVAKLCNNSHFVEKEENLIKPINLREATGDATDIALLKFATENIQDAELLIENYTEIYQVPFNSKNKWMMKTLQIKDTQKHNEIFQDSINEDYSSLMFLKGAPDRLLVKCATMLREDGSEVEIDSSLRETIVQAQNEWCMKGQRVLMLCKKVLDSEKSAKLMVKSQIEIEDFVKESFDFCLVGMVGIIDPPRPMISDVIIKCREAGIRVLMITGDYALTAAAIAREIGIFTNDSYDTIENIHEKVSENIETETKQEGKYTSLILNGTELESIKEDEWRLITQYDEVVFGRISPEQKLLIVKEFQRDGYIVGVTGDGVNDAPALKSADIGIAMGAGSEVAMEASQLVLLDNNFSSILIAIENGRLVFYNLRKVILYLLPAGSIGNLILSVFYFKNIEHFFYFYN